MGIIPSTKILNEEAPGFQFEVLLCGEKAQPLPLGGVKGLAALCNTIRQIPEFSKVPPIAMSISPGENILISTVDFANDVSNLFENHSIFYLKIIPFFHWLIFIPFFHWLIF